MGQKVEDQRKSKRIILKAKKPNGLKESESLNLNPKKADNDNEDDNEEDDDVEDEKDKKKKVRKKVNKESFDSLIDSYTDNLQLREELKNHLAVRKAKKGALTNRAIELSLKELDKLTEKLPVNDIELINEKKIKIVQQSIMKGWVGFFEIKENTGYKSNIQNNNIFAEIGREEGFF